MSRFKGPKGKAKATGVARNKDGLIKYSPPDGGPMQLLTDEKWEEMLKVIKAARD